MRVGQRCKRSPRGDDPCLTRQEGGLTKFGCEFRSRWRRPICRLVKGIRGITRVTGGTHKGYHGAITKTSGFRGNTYRYRYNISRLRHKQYDRLDKNKYKQDDKTCEFCTSVLLHACRCHACHAGVSGTVFTRLQMYTFIGGTVAPKSRAHISHSAGANAS